MSGNRRISWTRSSVLTRLWMEEVTRSGCFERNSVMAACFRGMAGWKGQWNRGAIAVERRCFGG